MTQKELAQEAARRLNFPDNAVNEVLEMILEMIAEAVANGDAVRLRKFGTFMPKLQAARTVRTGFGLNGPSQHLEPRWRAKFSPSKEFHARIQQQQTATEGSAT